MLETSLEHIGIITRFVFSLIGALGIFIILIKNNVLVLRISNLVLLKLLIVLSFSHSIFAFIGWGSHYKYFFSGFLLVVFFYKIVIKRTHLHLIRNFLLLTGLYVTSYFIIGADWVNALTIYVSMAFPLMLIMIITKNSQYVGQVKPLIKDLIILQVIMSVIKLILIGRNEALIGTIGYTGGSIATVFPFLALIFLWQTGYLKNNKKFIVWIIFLSIIAFASNKRAYWFILPIIALYIYNYKSKKNKLKLLTTLKYAPIILLLLYTGLRLNPTLNPDNKTGGNFDINYALNYAYDYTFADDKTAQSGIAHGRGAGVIMTIDNILNNFSQKTTLWGQGVDLLHAKKRSEQDFLKEFGFINSGVLTGFTRKFLTLGLLGVIAYLLYMIGIIHYARNSNQKHIYYLLLSFVLFEFFFYTANIFDQWGLTTMVVYIVAFEHNKKLRVNPEE